MFFLLLRLFFFEFGGWLQGDFDLGLPASYQAKNACRSRLDHINIEVFHRKVEFTGGVLNGFFSGFSFKFISFHDGPPVAKQLA
jgi:hypothetical protein